MDKRNVEFFAKVYGSENPSSVEERSLSHLCFSGRRAMGIFLKLCSRILTATLLLNPLG